MGKNDVCPILSFFALIYCQYIYAWLYECLTLCACDVLVLTENERKKKAKQTWAPLWKCIHTSVPSETSGSGSELYMLAEQINTCSIGKNTQPGSHLKRTHEYQWATNETETDGWDKGIAVAYCIIKPGVGPGYDRCVSGRSLLLWRRTCESFKSANWLRFVCPWNWLINMEINLVLVFSICKYIKKQKCWLLKITYNTNWGFGAELNVYSIQNWSEKERSETELMGSDTSFFFCTDVCTTAYIQAGETS